MKAQPRTLKAGRLGKWHHLGPREVAAEGEGDPKKDRQSLPGFRPASATSRGTLIHLKSAAIDLQKLNSGCPGSRSHARSDTEPGIRIHVDERTVEAP